MKKFEFYIHKGQIEKFFPKKRIKTKTQIIEILMESLQLIMQNNFIQENKRGGKIILVIEKMSRLFFITNDNKKIYSITFPFFIEKIDNSFIIKLKKFEYLDFIENENDNFIEIDYQLISNVLSFIKCDKFKEQCSLDFITPIDEYEQYNKNFWIFLREILLMEDGYIRYDYDEKNYKIALQKGEEHIHPLNHYDLFYSNNATFKIGLLNKISNDDMIEFLNVRKKCLYLIDNEKINKN
jgi:hypothetical protein